MNRSTQMVRILGALAALALIAAAPAMADHCVRAQVPGSFVVHRFAQLSAPPFRPLESVAVAVLTRPPPPFV